MWHGTYLRLIYKECTFDGNAISDLTLETQTGKRIQQSQHILQTVQKRGIIFNIPCRFYVSYNHFGEVGEALVIVKREPPSTKKHFNLRKSSKSNQSHSKSFFDKNKGHFFPNRLLKTRQVTTRHFPYNPTQLNQALTFNCPQLVLPLPFYEWFYFSFYIFLYYTISTFSLRSHLSHAHIVF